MRGGSECAEEVFCVEQEEDCKAYEDSEESGGQEEESKGEGCGGAGGDCVFDCCWGGPAGAEVGMGC